MASRGGTGGLVNYSLGVVILVIVVAAVAIPIINSVLKNANITGTTATILSFTPMFLALLILVIVIRPIQL